MPTSYNYSDAFISYSRRDSDFVKQFVEALKNEDRTVWVDWEDIPPSADWWSEIEAGIEAASNFVFIISPDSVGSEICYKEIEHAVANNKRLIPILYREIYDRDLAGNMHPSVSSHNWIFMRESEDFNEAMRSFITTLDTDLAYVRMHSRLLVRANEWDNNERSNSFLLTGQEIVDAESWLAESSAKEPNPTQLHSEYILVSRQQQDSRQRRLLIGVSAGLVVAIMLAILSGVLFVRSQSNLSLAQQRGTVAAEQAETAVAAQDTAVFNANLAEQNAATAVFNADLAEQNAATAESALDLSEDRGTEVAVQAETAVFNADLAEQNASTAVFNANLAEQNAATAESALDLSEDRGTEVAVQAETAVFNADLAEQNASTAVFNANLAEQNAATAESALGLSERRGTVAAEQASTAVAAQGTALFNADLAEQNAATALFNEGLAIAAAATSEASERQARSQALAVSAQQVLDAGDVDLALALAIESGEINPLLIQAQRVLSQAAPLGVRLNIRSYTDDVTFYQNPIQKATNPLGGGLAAFHPDNTRVAVANADHSISLYDINARQEIQQYAGHRERITDLTFSPDGTRMISSSSTVEGNATSGRLLLWDLDNPTAPTRLEGHVQGINAIAVRPGGEEIASVADDGTVILWSMNTGLEIVRFTDNEAGPLKEVVWNREGNVLFALSENTTVIRTIDEDYDTLRLLSTGTSVYQGFSENREYGYNGGNQPGSGSLAIWNATSGTRVREFSLQDFSINEEYVRFVDFSPRENQHVLVYLEQWQRISGSDLFYRGNKMAVWDIFSNSQVRELTELSDEVRVTAMTYHPGGQYVLTADNDGRSNVITLRGAETGLPLREYRGHEAIIDQLLFSPNGNHVISIARDGNVRIWDIFIDDASELDRSAVRIPVVPSENSRTPNIAISDDGNNVFLGKGSYISVLDEQIRQIDTPAFVGDTPLEVIFNSGRGLALIRNSAQAAYAPIILWDIAERNRLFTFGADNGDTYSDGIFSPDDNEVILAGKATEGLDVITRFDVTDPAAPESVFRTEIARQEAAEGLAEIRHIAVSQDGTRLATVGTYEDRLEGLTDQEMIVVWDANLGIALSQFRIDATGNIQSISFSPDGQSLLAAFSTPSNFMLQWDTQTGQLQVQYTAHIDTVNKAIYNDDGSLALSGSDDRSVILWDTASGQPIRSYTGHTEAVTDVIFHPEGDRVLSVDESEVITWQINTFQDTVEWVYANRFVPELSCAQRIQYNVRPYCDNDQPIEIVIQAASPTVIEAQSTTIEATNTPSSTPPPLPAAVPTSPPTATQPTNDTTTSPSLPQPTASATVIPTQTPSPIPPRAFTGSDTITAADPVPVRVRPSQVARSLPVPASPGDQVQQVEAVPGWVYIRMENGTEGWVPADAINNGETSDG